MQQRLASFRAGAVPESSDAQRRSPLRGTAWPLGFCKKGLRDLMQNCTLGSTGRARLAKHRTAPAELHAPAPTLRRTALTRALPQSLWNDVLRVDSGGASHHAPSNACR